MSKSGSVVGILGYKVEGRSELFLVHLDNGEQYWIPSSRLSNCGRMVSVLLQRLQRAADKHNNSCVVLIDGDVPVDTPPPPKRKKISLPEERVQDSQSSSSSSGEEEEGGEEEHTMGELYDSLDREYMAGSPEYLPPDNVPRHVPPPPPPPPKIPPPPVQRKSLKPASPKRKVAMMAPQPRGRPPKGQRWDPREGKWVKHRDVPIPQTAAGKK